MLHILWFKHRYNDIIYHVATIKVSHIITSLSPPVLCALPIHSSLCSESTDLFTASTVCLFQTVEQLESCSMWSIQIGFFRLCAFKFPSMTFHVFVAHHFLALNNIVLSGLTLKKE